MKLKGSCHCRAVSFEVNSHTPYPYMRCYCSICRKTAGGGGFAINIMGEAKSLRVRGKKFVSIYHAKLGKKQRSSGQRHFCKLCASCLWIYDSTWPEWVYPFASAIDTALPIPKNHVNILINSAANWCEIPHDKSNKNYQSYPELSIEEWHKNYKLLKK